MGTEQVYFPWGKKVSFTIVLDNHVMKHDKDIGKVIYSTPQDQAIKEFWHN